MAKALLHVDPGKTIPDDSCVNNGFGAKIGNVVPYRKGNKSFLRYSLKSDEGWQLPSSEIYRKTQGIVYKGRNRRAHGR